MTRHAAPRPAPVRSHRLRGWGTLRIEGSGEVVVHLHGTGSLEVYRLRRTAFSFEGVGARRFPDADHLVVAAAHGRLTLRGADLDVRTRRGHVDVQLTGSFRVHLEGRGEWESPEGTLRGWGVEPRVLTLA